MEKNPFKLSDDEIKAYSNKKIELLITGKRCEGVLVDQFEDRGVWWMRLDNFRFAEEEEGKKRDNYRVRIEHISAYGPAE